MVDNPDEKTLLNALMVGVRAEGPLMAEIGKKNIQKITLPQFMKLAEDFIHQEELVGTLFKAQTLEEQAKQESKKTSTAPRPKKEKNPRKGENKSGPPFKSEPRKTKLSRFQQEVFTPLNASFTEVFRAIKGDPAFKWSPKMRTDLYRRDQNKFCEYYANHGHSTEDCMSLRQEIENFVRNGKLIRFLAQKKIWEANQQGHLEGGQEGLGHAEPRRQDQASREGLYDQVEEQRNAREVQRPLQN
jgi:hypothetical protein